MPVSPGTSSLAAARRRAGRPARSARRVFSGRNAAILLLVAGLFIGLHYSEFHWREIPGLLERVNRPLALVLMATLPIFGFPITAVYLTAGAIFGPLWGGVVIAGVTVAHVTGTHFLARTALRKPVARWHEAWVRRLPVISKGDNISLVAMIVIVPGLPYLARNCLLAVSDVPLRFVYGVGVPLYVARSYSTLFLGDAGGAPTAKTFWLVGTLFVVKLAISGLLFLRLRWHSARADRARAAAGGPS